MLLNKMKQISFKNSFHKLKFLARLGANYLLNVGPDALGRIPARCAEILKAAAPARA